MQEQLIAPQNEIKGSLEQLKATQDQPEATHKVIISTSKNAGSKALQPCHGQQLACIIAYAC